MKTKYILACALFASVSTSQLLWASESDLNNITCTVDLGLGLKNQSCIDSEYNLIVETLGQNQKIKKKWTFARESFWYKALSIKVPPLNSTLLVHYENYKNNQHAVIYIETGRATVIEEEPDLEAFVSPNSDGKCILDYTQRNNSILKIYTEKNQDSSINPAKRQRTASVSST